MGIFAFCAAVVAFLAILDLIDGSEVLWWWLMFIALHFAFGWALPLVLPTFQRRERNG